MIVSLHCMSRGWSLSGVSNKDSLIKSLRVVSIRKFIEADQTLRRRVESSHPSFFGGKFAVEIQKFELSSSIVILKKWWVYWTAYRYGNRIISIISIIFNTLARAFIVFNFGDRFFQAQFGAHRELEVCKRNLFDCFGELFTKQCYPFWWALFGRHCLHWFSSAENHCSLCQGSQKPKWACGEASYNLWNEFMSWISAPASVSSCAGQAGRR